MSSEIRTFKIRDAAVQEDELALGEFLRTVDVARIETTYAGDGVPRTHWQRWQCGAAHEMRGGPSEAAIRGRLQTASSCIGQEPVW